MIWERQNSISQINFLTDTYNCIMKNTPEKNVKILDLGCGRGLFGYLLRCYHTKNIYLCGVELDIKEDKFKILLENIYDKIIKNSILNFKIEEKFDLVLINHVLEHLFLNDAIKLIKYLQESNLCDKILVGFPISQEGHEYNLNNNNPHTHKFSKKEFPFDELNFKTQLVKNPRLFLTLWEKNDIVVKKENIVKEELF